MSTEFQPIPQNKTVVNTANPSPTGPKSVLRNKTAVQSENISRTPFRTELKQMTELNTVLNEQIEAEQLKGRSKQVHGFSPGKSSKKGISIQEHANTVREIPRDNNGTTVGKIHSMEPSWLDGYRRHDGDETPAADLEDMRSRLQTLRS